MENTVPNLILEESVLGRMFIDMAGKDPKEVYQAVEANSWGFRKHSHCRPGKKDECNAGRESASSGRGI